MSKDLQREKKYFSSFAYAPRACRFLRDLPGLDGGFDLVTAFDVIHDLPQPAAALANANALLKPSRHMPPTSTQCLSGSLYLFSYVFCVTFVLSESIY
jgi:2-polyprenyl-3-methyl-5-hydroxy-6-metoxy-1,4-benzoquinol methylase